MTRRTGTDAARTGHGRKRAISRVYTARSDRHEHGPSSPADASFPRIRRRCAQIVLVSRQPSSAAGRLRFPRPRSGQRSSRPAAHRESGTRERAGERSLRADRRQHHARLGPRRLSRRPACAGRPTPRSSISTGASPPRTRPRPTSSAATGGVPRKLSDDEVKNIPPAAGGRWDKARRRVLFVDGGDVVHG